MHCDHEDFHHVGYQKCQQQQQQQQRGGGGCGAPPGGCLGPGAAASSSSGPAGAQRREKVSDHGQDGNELQTTPEFRAHVAKKLGAILDSSITILKHSPGPAQDDLQSSETEDDGFRLFSSSVPGDCGEPEPQTVGRRRQQYCSSSEQDSDEEWQRCQEATVTAADILKHSGLPAALQNSSQDHHCPATEPSQKKKRRKKKAKVNGENSNEWEARGAHHNQADAGTEGPSCFDGASRRGENTSTEDMAVMKKRKKKKKRGEVEIRRK
ncbi:protein CUSTOS isoform X2 [Zootoca vivipara]|uniref:protein CUSTOS isoform X2 n=1 Tax=Zootoca vivipara TaxID=8524 RepID=UPI00293B8AFB|nr:protein CUSTOS isoform X2 [Zootoca vivipara]